LCWVGPPDRLGFDRDIEPLTRSVRSGRWFGRANGLSSTHRQEWTAIDRVHAATAKPRTPAVEAPVWEETGHPPASCRSEAAAAEIIRQRRSAQAFDGVTAIAAAALYRMLDASLPRAGVPPFAGWPWAPRVHLVLFINRVQGLRPGLYVFLRGQAGPAILRSMFKPDFEWLPVEQGTASFPLFRLLPADARQAAKLLSCQQDIAGDGAFSLGMLAELDGGLSEGPWVYRRLFWETGLVGQVLYLEAEAAGVRGTGIGCFFDDPVHELLGLEGTRLQSLYHFTVGGPQVDSRLQTLPPYAHLQASRKKPNE
jgi:nitroreductase